MALPQKTPFQKQREAWARLELLRLAQSQSDEPLIMCGYCSGDTRILPGDPHQLVECETCGAKMKLAPRPDGGIIVHPVCDSPNARRRNA
jgi:predicted nucleic acid-binding Zn ribbon protein